LTFQSILRRIFAAPLLGEHGRRFLYNRVWRVERGAGAGLKLRFPQNSDFVSGTSELPVQQEIAALLRPGDVFYDIGANVGFFTLIAARIVGDHGCVCAFEPHPHNAAAIHENAGLNAFSHVRVFEVAAGRNTRNDELIMTDWDGGGALSSSVVKPAAAARRTAVRVVQLDEFTKTESLPPPNFVKIDVEGAELEVLDGMINVIIRHKPHLLYEVDDPAPDRFRHRWDDLDQRVSGLGYRVRRLKNSYPNLNWNVGHSIASPSEQ